jgi:hypothetical protein
MFKKIWHSFVRWFRKLFGGGKQRISDRIPNTDLPLIDDTDREYLFMQLLEGVAHGWQQPRAITFFNKIRQRVRKSEWLEWLDKFGGNLLSAPVPNYELANRMVQLGQLDCGEIGDLAGDYGTQLLNRQAEEFSGNLLPILEFSNSAAVEFDPIAGDIANNGDWEFSEIPPELLAVNDLSLLAAPPQSFATQPESTSPAGETREITLEEFSAMLHKEPGLVAELAEQFGVETTDPQVIINAVVAQMQQQVQISGDLSQNANEPTAQTPSAEAMSVTPALAPVNPVIHSEPVRPAPIHQAPPPPPPPSKLEFKSEDPWNNESINDREPDLSRANLLDRGI